MSCRYPLLYPPGALLPHLTFSYPVPARIPAEREHEREHERVHPNRVRFVLVYQSYSVRLCTRSPQLLDF